MSKPFKLNSAFRPSGDQPEAIRRLEEGLEDGLAHQTLLGVTGSGKTFTIANVIADLQRPTMVLAPNKTLAAQLYGEMKEFFPENAVLTAGLFWVIAVIGPAAAAGYSGRSLRAGLSCCASSQASCLAPSGFNP